jgi:hypothetical protein
MPLHGTDKQMLVSLSVMFKIGSTLFFIVANALLSYISQCMDESLIMPGKRAKILSAPDVNDLLVFASCTRHPLRNAVHAAAPPTSKMKSRRLMPALTVQDKAWYQRKSRSGNSWVRAAASVALGPSPPEPSRSAGRLGPEFYGKT